MKSNKTFFKILSVGLALALLTSEKTFAFGSRSHERLSTLAFNREIAILEKIGWLNEREYSRAVCLEDLTHSAVDPDRTETGGASRPYAGHFYNPHYDHFPDNALTRMAEHFDRAINYARRKHKKDAIKELGRSLHYLQDLCCPVHIWGYDFNGHTGSIISVFGGATAIHATLERDWDNLWERANFVVENLPNLDLILSKLPPAHQCTASHIGQLAFEAAWYKHGRWVRSYHEDFDSTTYKILAKYNPAAWITSNILSGIHQAASTKDTAINDGWGDIFIIPYLASHTLICLFVYKVMSFVKEEKEAAKKREEE